MSSSRVLRNGENIRMAETTARVRVRALGGWRAATAVDPGALGQCASIRPRNAARGLGSVPNGLHWMGTMGSIARSRNLSDFSSLIQALREDS